MSFDWSRIVQPSRTRSCAEDVQRFEEALGFPLPTDYREFLREFNGGTVILDHDIRVPEAGFGLRVAYFYPVAPPIGYMGIGEIRKLQALNRLCLRQAVSIGDDRGTGEYYLVLAGERSGTVLFIWLDDRPILTSSQWETSEINIPEDMVDVSPSFDDLGRLILDNRRNEGASEGLGV